MIHCAVGVSRSVTLTVAYVMTVTGLTYPQALSVVQYRRPIANPNDGFKRQLEAFGKSEVIIYLGFTIFLFNSNSFFFQVLNREIARFRKKFDKKLDRFDDLHECKQVLAQLENT